jgi:peptidylprolyl isomerase
MAARMRRTHKVKVMRSFWRSWSCLTLLFALAVGGAAAAAEDAVIAKLGDKPVKVSDIADALASVSPAVRQQAARDPKVRMEVVQSAIGRNAVLVEAAKKAWEKQPDVVAQIERAKKEIIVTSFLRSINYPPSSYPSEVEIQRTYEANREKLMTPRLYHLAQIFVVDPDEPKAGAPTAKEKKARELAKKARAKGADFAELAGANSEDTSSASHGGDLGMMAEPQIVPPILAAIKAGGEKGITDPVYAGGGWHIIEILSVKPSEVRPLHQVRDEIINGLRENKLRQDSIAYITKLLNEQHLTVDEAAIAALFPAAK